MRRLAAIAVGALLVAIPASAKGVAPFERATARPGQTIRIGAGLFANGAVDAWLLPLARAHVWWPDYSAVEPTYGPRLRLLDAVPLGSIPHWGTIAVRVPNVPPGRYVLAYWMPSTHARWTSARPDYLPSTGNVLRVTR